MYIHLYIVCTCGLARPGDVLETSYENEGWKARRTSWMMS